MVVEFTTPQLHLLRSLDGRGFPVNLLENFVLRCGASPAEWEALVRGGLVEDRAGRFELTDKGRREYRKAKKGRYF